jgi:catechol 2,3-dioxygenase-like lactoylglutathione lyase family enzyme
MAWQLGRVGHFSIAVIDPERSSRWWVEKIGVERQFDFDAGVAVGTDAITIVLTRGQPDPGALGHMSFHLPSMQVLREALADLRRAGVELEDPGDEIGPEAPGSPNMGLWFHDLDGYRWELNVQADAPGSDP